MLRVTSAVPARQLKSWLGAPRAWHPIDSDVEDVSLPSLMLEPPPAAEEGSVPGRGGSNNKDGRNRNETEKSQGME